MSSMRVSRRDVQGYFEHWCKRHGFRVAASYKDVGGLTMDYAGCYGGYRIERVYNAEGAVDQPFGAKRFKAAQMIDMMEFADDFARAVKGVAHE